MRLIDAGKLVETIVNTPSEVAKIHTYNVLTSLAERQNEILDIVENSPTIEAAPVVHGYWREYNRSALVSWKNGEPVWVDRAVYYCDGCSFGTIIKHNYCPRCGQKMDGCVSDG